MSSIQSVAAGIRSTANELARLRLQVTQVIDLGRELPALREVHGATIDGAAILRRMSAEAGSEADFNRLSQAVSRVDSAADSVGMVLNSALRTVDSVESPGSTRVAAAVTEALARGARDASDAVGLIR